MFMKGNDFSILPFVGEDVSVNRAIENGPFPLYMKFEKIQNRQKFHHSLKEQPMFTKIAKFGCEML